MKNDTMLGFRWHRRGWFARDEVLVDPRGQVVGAVQEFKGTWWSHDTLKSAEFLTKEDAKIAVERRVLLFATATAKSLKQTLTELHDECDRLAS